MTDNGWPLVDAGRFITDYCNVLGMPATSVSVTHAPSLVELDIPVDRLTGHARLDTRIAVQIRGETIEGEGIDLAEAITETMAALSRRCYPRRFDRIVEVDDTDPSCQIADGQRVWFVEGAEAGDDRLLVDDEDTGQQVVIGHASWNSLIGAVAYFQQMHCESCPDVALDVPDDFVLIPGIE